MENRGFRNGFHVYEYSIYARFYDEPFFWPGSNNWNVEPPTLQRFSLHRGLATGRPIPVRFGNSSESGILIPEETIIKNHQIPISRDSQFQQKKSQPTGQTSPIYMLNAPF